MMLTFGLVVFLSTIILVYAQEIGRVIRKLIAIPGVRLLVPLAFGSWLIETYEAWGRWLLLYAQAEFYNFIQYIAERLPFQTGSLYLIRIMCLFLLACVPALYFWFMIKRKGLYKLPVYSYYFGASLWIIAVFLLIVQPL